MTLLEDQQGPQFTLAPLPGQPKPKHKKHNKWMPWHRAVMIVGVPVIAFLSCVGVNTVTHWWADPVPVAHAETVAKPKPTPANAGLNDSEAQVLMKDLRELRRYVHRIVRVNALQP